MWVRHALANGITIVWMTFPPCRLTRWTDAKQWQPQERRMELNNHCGIYHYSLCAFYVSLLVSFDVRIFQSRLFNYQSISDKNRAIFVSFCPGNTLRIGERQTCFFSSRQTVQMTWKGLRNLAFHFCSNWTHHSKQLLTRLLFMQRRVDAAKSTEEQLKSNHMSGNILKHLSLEHPILEFHST